MSAFIDGGLANLLEASVKAFLLALIAAALLFVLRLRNHNVHHRIWITVLAAMLCLPILQRATPAVLVPAQLNRYLGFAADHYSKQIDTSELGEHEPGPARATDRSAHSTAATSSGVDSESPSVIAGAEILAESRKDVRENQLSGQSNDEKNPIDLMAQADTRSSIGNTSSHSRRTTLFVIYAIGVVVFVCRFGLGAWTARRLVRRCRPIAFNGQRAFECDAVHIPLTIGIFHSRILLPKDWSTWSKDLLACVLQHEQAHIDRKDNLVMAVAEINRCLYWFHPLAWFLRRRLATLAETTCDDMVVAATGDRRRYAQHLLHIASRVSRVHGRVTALGTSMARTTQVELRIEAILDATRPMARRLGWHGRLALAVVGIPLVSITAGLRGGVTLPPTPNQTPPGQHEEPARNTRVVNTTAKTEPQRSVGQGLARNSTNGKDVYGDPLPSGAIARLGTVRYRHPGWYKRMAFLPDGQTILVGTNENTVRAWNALTGKLAHEIDVDDDSLQSFCLATNGRLVATLSQKINPETRECQMRLAVWDTESWRERYHSDWKEPLGEAAQQMAFSADSKTIAMGALSGNVRLYDVASGQLLRREDIIKGEVDSLSFSPNGELIAVASQQEVVIWALRSGDRPKKLPGLSRGGQIVRFSPNGAVLVVGSSVDCAARIYDAQSRKLLRKLNGKSESYYREGLCFSSDGKQLIVPASEPHTVEVFDIESGQLVRNFDAGVIKPRDATISADGRLLACIGSEAAIIVWDTRTGERLSDRFVGHLESPFELAFTPDDSRIVTGATDGAIRVWDASTGKHERVLSHDGWVAALAIAPSGEWLASCGLDDTVRLWDFAAGRERFHLYGHGKTGGSRSTKVAFSPDGKRFFSFGSDMYLRVYSTENGRVLAEHAIRLGGAPQQESEDGLPRVSDDLFGDDGVGQATFAPNGNVLVLSDSRGSAVHFFDITSGKEVDVFRPDDHLQNFAISPDGKSLATFEQSVKKNAQGNPSRNRMYALRMRDFASKLVIREFVLPGRFANQVAFSPDSKSIGFTELENSSVRKPKQWISILDTASMRHVTQIDIIGRSTRGLAFSHDGTKLATSHEDSSVIVWELKNFRKDNVVSE